MNSFDTRPTNLLLESEYSNQRKALIALGNELQSLGAQLDIHVPKIVAIGNQSSGKSSLVEAISGIKVPRESGTCTRCPFEVRLHHQELGPWSCQVKLRFDNYLSSGEAVCEETFGSIIFNPIEVEERLRKAQKAILSPEYPSQHFLDTSDEDEDQFETLKFSRNAVSVEIWGPEVVDLTFVDLPGIISNGADKEISLVRSLVLEQISTKCIILLTLTMRDDLENQSAAALARQVDVSGTRTIGVLTKPDTLQAGEEEIWLQIIKGEKLQHRLLNGYYVTRLPGPVESESSLTAQETRKLEENFFCQDPWNNLPSEIRGRLGVPNLIQTLSNRLLELILESFPYIKSKISELYRCTEEEISNLPSPPSDDCVYEVRTLLAGFINQLDLKYKGLDFSGCLWRELRKLFKDFKSKTWRKITCFCPLPNLNTTHHQACINRDEFTLLTAPEANVVWLSMDTEGPDVLHMNDVSKVIEASITRELPKVVPYSAKLRLIMEPYEEWKQKSRNLLQDSCIIFESSAEEIIQQQFSSYIHTGLLDAVLQIMTEAINDSFHEMKKVLEQLLLMDSYPYTQNEDFSKVTSELLEQWKLWQEDRRQPEFFDSYRRELQVAAEVSAYQVVAWKVSSFESILISIFTPVDGLSLGCV
ncbi:hypothetical protein CROQUDRAFT_656895 [Cronartium quercuum f. sp. fusiforme G11]|uniref:Dynamin-type G domain-containing protein n=1 Tax=Cronartium quercuum f. sp. fusiforme G11 TaxID=708437 RepID=A0A9P6NMR1_9BASI|nr:hypothetical protein CROQUDRAFT_656895 [Cronartium quercuum f. sp. fusiforme G11]